jgi:hypothetical protein
MLKLRHVPRLLLAAIHLTAVSALFFAIGGSAHAVPVMINSGSAPPNPQNVIDKTDNYSGDGVYIRNVGCPPAWSG